MKFDLIKHELNRTNYNLLITIIIMFGITASVFMSQANDIYNLIFGPFPVNISQIQSMNKKEFKDKVVPFAGITEEAYKDMTQTEIDKIKSSDYSTETAILGTKSYKFDRNRYFGLIKGKPVQKLEGFTSYVDFSYSSYVLVPYGDGIIIVKATNADIENGEFKGVFAPMTESLEADIKPLISPEYKGKIYENVFYAMGSFEITAEYNIFFVFLFIAFTGFLIFKLIRRYINPKYHPLYKKISIYGDTDVIVDKINDEFLMRSSKVYKNEIATPSFKIKRNFWRTLITLNELNETERDEPDRVNEAKHLMNLNAKNEPDPDESERVNESERDEAKRVNESERA